MNEGYNPKNPDAFSQKELKENEETPLNIIQVNEQVSTLKEGSFESKNFRHKRSGWRLREDGTLEAKKGIFGGQFDIGGTNITIDESQDIQSYLDQIYAEGGGTLYLQNGTYLLTNDVYIPSGVVLEGVSRDSVIIDGNSNYSLIMMGSDDYSDGTLTINSGDTAVVGSGTTWTDAMVGRYIWLDGYWYKIYSRTNNTHITLSEAFSGNNLAGADYKISSIVINSAIRNLTVQNATNAYGILLYETFECFLDNVNVYSCTTGVGIQYSVFPTIRVTADSNATNFSMSHVSGFNIDWSVFSNSTNATGVTMSYCKDATCFNSSSENNTTNGISLTNCNNIVFVATDVTNNGAKGIELIANNNDIQFVSVSSIGNVSDGYKLTATSDRISISTCSITDNGGYGINIAAATCDNNYIIAPAFNNNTSGNLNDSGTNTISLPTLSESFPEQDLPFKTTTVTATASSAFVTTTLTGDIMFLVTQDATTDVIRIIRLLKNTTTKQYYITHSVTYTPSAATAITECSCVVIGNYLYVIYRLTGVGNYGEVRRFDKADLTNGVSMTISGTNMGTFPSSAFTDGTYLYVFANSSGQYNKYSISGTTLTYVSDTTYTSAGAPPYGAISDGTSVWITDSDGTSGSVNIRKYTIGNSAVVSTTTPYVFADSYPNNGKILLFLPYTTVLGIGYAYTIDSNSAVKGCAIKLTGISLP